MKRQEFVSLAAEQVQTAAGCLSSMVEPVAVFAAVEHYCCFGLSAAFELKLPSEQLVFVVVQLAFVVVQPVSAAVQESLSDR